MLLSAGISADPLSKIQASHAAFSPNSDGYRDSVFFSIQNPSSEVLHPSDWKVIIEDASGNIVKTFSADRRWIRPHPSISNFFIPDQYSRRQLRIFQDLEWNGKNEENRVVPDGIYFISSEVTDQKGKVRLFQKTSVSVDTVPPKIFITPENSILIVPSDSEGKPLRNTNEVSILQNSDSEGIFSGRIVDLKGKTVEKRLWSSVLPERALWNGRTVNGKPADYGMYRYFLTAEDDAGNRSFAEYGNFIITEKKPEIYLDCEDCLFNPQHEKADFKIVFFNKIDRYKILSKLQKADWHFEIFYENEPIPLFSKKGRGFPDRLKADLNRSGQKLKDGKYRAKLTFRLNNEQIESPISSFILDSTPPQVSWKTSSDMFTPDGDFHDDTILFSGDYHDFSRIDSWLLQVYICPDLEKSPVTLYRSFRGRNFFPETIRWSGVGDMDQDLKSNEFLEFRFFVKDKAGNVSGIINGKFKTGILVKNFDAEGKILKIQIPEQRFFRNQTELTSIGKSVLRDFLGSLDRYAWYHIHLESHVSFPGVEEENLDLTEKRSKNIFQYLSGKVKKDRRMDYRGFGESEMIEIKDDPFVHYRNSRIEITLERKDVKKRD